MKTSLSLLLLCLSTISFAQLKPFDAATIPEALKKNAYSVKREERIEFEVKAINKATYKVHRVVTVFDEKGRDELLFRSYTDQFSSLESFAIQIFDSRGASIKKYKRSDLAVQIAGEGLVPDGKVYYLDIPVQTYPVTISIDYEERSNGLLNYQDYLLQIPEQSVENSLFTAIVPVELDLRFKGKNTNLTPQLGNDGKVKTYTWSVKSLPALEEEEGAVAVRSRYPRILLSPNKFELDGYPGDMTSWNSFGKWIISLMKNTSNLTEERKQFFRNLVKDAPDDHEKAKIIYSYLQANCRYVSIQLGIGGYKPFEADFVDKKKYGDCKALSNYTHACLSAVGIKSHYALINAKYNEEPVDPNFPDNGFNHIILCIPFQKDTAWLECTSNTTEFGVLGNFTENRNALLITDDGGTLVATPRSKASDNVFTSNTTINLAADGSGLLNIAVHGTGEFKQEMIYYIANQKKDDQKNYLVNYLGYMLPDEFEVNAGEAQKNEPTTIQMSIGKIPEFTAGKKMFLNPRVYKIWKYTLPKAENRTLDYYFEHPFIKNDTTIYQLPEGFGIETLPKGKRLSFEYGSLVTSYEYDESKRTVKSVASLRLNEYKIPAAKFLACKNFFNDVLGEYTEKIVVKKL